MYLGRVCESVICKEKNIQRGDITSSLPRDIITSLKGSDFTYQLGGEELLVSRSLKEFMARGCLTSANC